MGPEQQLDRFPQQRLQQQQADATGAVVRPEVHHQAAGELGPPARGQAALGQEQGQIAQPHHPLDSNLRPSVPSRK